jgi:hypothetical protein
MYAIESTKLNESSKPLAIRSVSASISKTSLLFGELCLTHSFRASVIPVPASVAFLVAANAVPALYALTNYLP